MLVGCLVQASIDVLQKQYVVEAFMRNLRIYKFSFRLFTLNENDVIFAKYNSTVQTVFKFISQWLHKDCFSFYKNEDCSVKDQHHVEIPVKIADLMTVWLLLTGLFMVSLFIYIYDILKSKLCNV